MEEPTDWNGDCRPTPLQRALGYLVGIAFGATAGYVGAGSASLWAGVLWGGTVGISFGVIGASSCLVVGVLRTDLALSLVIGGAILGAVFGAISALIGHTLLATLCAGSVAFFTWWSLGALARRQMSQRRA